MILRDGLTSDAVTVFNTVDAWWGEGDEKISRLTLIV